MHIIRDKNAFRQLTGQKIRIRGVNGISSGEIGYLHDCVLGVCVRAVHLPSLPVGALISVRGLKASRWEILFSPNGDRLTNLNTGAFISLTETKSGLPSIPTLKLFAKESEDEDDGLICTPADEPVNDHQSFLNSSQFGPIPSHIKNAVLRSQSARRKRGPESKKASQML